MANLRIVQPGGEADRVSARRRWGARSTGFATPRFASFETDEDLTVWGDQADGSDVALCVPLGIHAAHGRRLRLVLPAKFAYAVDLRRHWIDHPIDLYVYADRAAPTLVAKRTKKKVLQALELAVQNGEGIRSPGWHPPARSVSAMSALAPSLLEYLSANPELSPGHRGSYRAWHYSGRKVLEVSRLGGKSGIRITAGVHSSSGQYSDIILELTSRMTEGQFRKVVAEIDRAIEHRKTDPSERQSHLEHWLQSVLRENPGSLGLEEPILRELPAWRPRSEDGHWGRGYIDLIGLDPAGRVHVVETKIAPDPMLVMQGLDYWIWSSIPSNQARIRARLDIDPKAEFVLDFVIGAPATSHTDASTARVHPSTRDVAKTLSDVPTQFATVANWHVDPDRERPSVAWLRPGTTPRAK